MTRNKDLQELHAAYNKCEIRDIPNIDYPAYMGYRLGRCRICGLAYKTDSSLFDDLISWVPITHNRAVKLLKKQRTLLRASRHANHPKASYRNTPVVIPHD